MQSNPAVKRMEDQVKPRPADHQRFGRAQSRRQIENQKTGQDFDLSGQKGPFQRRVGF